MTASAPKINLLPENLIDQIKAGEVIERPGNLIKEILENAIDAGATKLELTLRNLGLDLINLKDNGHGIRAQDIGLAFSRHATSKISHFEDLYRLTSFGFRGEALASISAVSKVQCISFTTEQPEGVEVRLEGGFNTFQGPRQKNGIEHGTELNIQDLFFNTPVRLKFIQSQQTEKNFLKKIIYSFILAHPNIEFVIKFDDEEKIFYSIRDTYKERIEDLIPKSKNITRHICKGYQDNQLELFLFPGEIRSPTKIQNIYINHRLLLDRQLHRVLTSAMEAHLGKDNFQFLLFLSVPSENIDVNVHPNKTIIKIFESSKLLSLITGSVKELARPAFSTQNPEAEKIQMTPLLDSSSIPEIHEPYAYNMDGIFSPHQLSKKDEQFLWIGKYIIFQKDHRWFAVSPARLLNIYICYHLERPASGTIPLLVSEPFKVKDISSVHLKKLQDGGIELEQISLDTLVLRSIPNWLNGFPLKPIVEKLILQQSMQDIELSPNEWTQSTWIEMLNEFPLEMIDLELILKEKLK
jgi:DNA mismatch repair protein MutL